MFCLCPCHLVASVLLLTQKSQLSWTQFLKQNINLFWCRNCRGSTKRNTNQNQWTLWYDQGFNLMCRGSPKPHSMQTSTPALPVWTQLCRMLFALIGQRSSWCCSVLQVLDEAKHREQKRCNGKLLLCINIWKLSRIRKKYNFLLLLTQSPSLLKKVTIHRQCWHSCSCF